ncbi:hypothetical protein [Paenibacillus sp. y28]|uniref:hypothetical protein n=1 Tax=Paenibacillus sp. y28 TaxID=3129110 RepID=UPI0030195599
MGVKFGREYEDILKDLTAVLLKLEDCRDFLDMTEEEWAGLDEEERAGCVETMADDLFYALGTDKEIEIGQATITHDAANHVIKVMDGGVVHVVRLV